MTCTCDAIGEGACPDHGEVMHAQDILLRDREPRISKSGLLTVVVEPDVEAPDDEKAWTLVLACEGSTVPKYFGGGYLHPPECDCARESTKNQLCDVGWLQEFVACVGVSPLVEENLTPYIDKGLLIAPFFRFQLTGRMVSERCDHLEGYDYDERFEIEDVVPFGHTGENAGMEV